MASDGSITRLIVLLNHGDRDAAQPLWDAYFRRLVALARARLQGAPRGMADEEDVALSAFDSFCRGLDRGRFPRLTDRNDLWRLLVVLTVRKAIDQIQRQGAAGRGGDRRAGEFDPLGGGDEPDGDPLDRLLSDEPTPEFAAMVAEQHRRLHDALRDAALGRVLDLRLAGHTREEIAEEMGCAVATVKRRLGTIRQIWLEDET
jgi:DNA-directed RNA polymerase specialized sigma24 family protein